MFLQGAWVTLGPFAFHRCCQYLECPERRTLLPAPIIRVHREIQPQTFEIARRTIHLLLTHLTTAAPM